MPVYRIPREHVFPDPRLADPSGLLGVGGDLHPTRVMLAYRMGIFPWFNEGDPILWHSPDPRVVLYPDELHIPRSLGKRIRQRRYEITMNRAFEQVIGACGATERPGQDGTWITRGMERTYRALHLANLAHSIEAWQDGELVGGLYGVAIGDVFAGESMFARAPDASKVAFVHFVRQFQRWGGRLIDCQVQTKHLKRFGARPISREAYLDALDEGRDRSLHSGPWTFDDDFTTDGR